MPIRTGLRHFLRAAAICLLISFPSSHGSAQNLPASHTRDITRVSQIQIAECLKRRDVIFVAAGTIEAQGISPGDREYIAPLGSAAQMAEAADAVYMPNPVLLLSGFDDYIARHRLYLHPAGRGQNHVR